MSVDYKINKRDNDLYLKNCFAVPRAAPGEFRVCRVSLILLFAFSVNASATNNLNLTSETLVKKTYNHKKNMKYKNQKLRPIHVENGVFLYPKVKVVTQMGI